MQEILHANDVGELSDANASKLRNLILDGRRKDALYFIERYTGLGERHANDAIDNIIANWGADHNQPAGTALLVAAGVPLFIVGLVLLVWSVMAIGLSWGN